ncbi:hypothetical protein [Jiulongibacter sediminis]|uniref:Outer membrane protein beta-barrel domain-containing protein n=1 Tax=Jiulongibacter sediminis TaxID=1605367 RepID=A0A0P7BI51_9BACT|nr:hypothetical protein [Jiulongibacter sediminis]KPM46752.1 hypothetical protein AFM12_18500 [Jiulongibacter sediminis]TBX21657.1 hypothetical protein TK44_18505 [Jiulongibacter sediminis]
MIFKTFVLSSIALLGCLLDSNAQDELPLEKNAVSFQIMGGTALAGFVYERSVTEHLSVEAGAGWISGMAGLKYFPFKMKTKKLLPSIGVQASASPLYSDCELCFGGDGLLLYLPVGLSYFGQKGLNLGIDGGYATVFEGGFLYGSLKIGKRF